MRTASTQRALRAGATQLDTTIHSLETGLLERILRLVAGVDTGWESNQHLFSLPQRDRKTDAPWNERRTPAEMCRLSEALVYADLDSAHHGIGAAKPALPPCVPPGVTAREMECYALLSR